MRTYLLCLSLLTFLSCGDDDDTLELFNRNEPDDITGLNYVEAENGNFDSIYTNLITALRSNANIGIVAEVNHQSNASTIGQTLAPTRVVLFGNPSLGTPLMQLNPQAGLDLPQKMLVYQADDDDVIVAYNTVEYLANRHGVGNASTLGDIRNALSTLAGTVGMDDVITADDNDVNRNEGVITVTGTGSVDSVYTRLRGALTENANISIVAELDHQANAASVGLELPPIRLIVFGNPALGTPLLQDEQTIGIDLPQKMLVYDAGDGRVAVAYNDPSYLAQRHEVNDDLPELGTIRDALANLAAAALDN